jgi:predicted N-acyltransferase
MLGNDGFKAHLCPMRETNETLEIHVLDSIARIAPAEWDACAGPDNPFVSHAFLAALEESGSVTRDTGWMPRHLIAKRPEGKVLGCVPLYLKNHSFGEYVFDWNWAEWYHRKGGRYYPKLQCSVPFCPVTGPRLLAGDGPDRAAIANALAQGLIAAADQWGVSSLHVTFPTDQELPWLEGNGFMMRQGFQFHWTNPGYVGFQDFLDALASRKRKQIRKERQSVAQTGLTFTTLVGDEIKSRHWDHFHRFYLSTVDRKMGEAYLNRRFFEALSASPAGQSVVLMLAMDGDEPMAGALNLMGGGTLYGRNWGADRDVPYLHFELCYYRAIDFAIANGLARVEAGAQGEHKLDRGYLPAATWSGHWIKEPAFATAVKGFLVMERAAIAREMDRLAGIGPFKKTAE